MSASEFWGRGRTRPAENEASEAGALSFGPRLTGMDRCDGCGAQAYVRFLLPRNLELLFCAHHSRQYASGLALIAIAVQDETDRLTRAAA